MGHVRYSTAGGQDVSNTQPLTARFSKGELALAHNGNLTNHLDLRSRLVEDGAIFRSRADSETLVHLIAKSRHETVDTQVDDGLSHLEGAFSIIMSVNSTIYAARDPRGFRPLVLGRVGDGHIVASETCALDILGRSVRTRPEAGRGDPHRPRQGREPPLAQAPRTDTPRASSSWSTSLDPDSSIWGRSVDGARRAFGRQLAREHPVEADAVMAVPDSANSAALGFAEESGIPFELGLLRNHYVGRTFIKPEQQDRDFGARMKYNPVREVVDGPSGCHRR